MSKSRRGLRSVIVCLFFCLAAQAGAFAAPGRHPLWSVRGDCNTLYLLGSVHVLNENHYPLSPPIEAAFQRSRTVVFETDLARFEEPDVRDDLLERASLPGGQSLSQQVSPQLYGRFNEEILAAGLRAGIFDSLKPSIAALTLQVLAMQKLGFSPEYGVDRYFFDRARSCGKHVLALETTQFQIALLTGLSPGEEELFLQTTLDELGNTRQSWSALLRAWQMGDISSLGKLLNRGRLKAPSLFHRLVVERNESWLPRIEELLHNDDDVLVVVGVGHVVGRDGLLDLLRRKGWTVTQN